MIKPLRLLLLATTAAPVLTIATASQATVVLQPGTPALILVTRSANDVGATPGERISIIDDNVSPNSAGGTSVVATTTNTATNTIATQTLVNQPTNAGFPDQFSRTIAYNAGLTGPWTLNVSNGTQSAQVVTPSIAGFKPVPFASQVTVSGASANPTFSWLYPANSVNGVIINIYNLNQPLPLGGYNVVYKTTLPGTANSFTVPTQLIGPLTLQQGTPYELEIYGVQSRNGALPLSNANSAVWSEAFFKFTPLAAGSPQVNLPIVAASGAYQYSMSVIGGKEVFIDPTIATGYEYKIGAGDPNFASVELPDIQTDPFDVAYLLNGVWTTALVNPGATFDFPNGGVAIFDVTGIDPALMLDPANTTAFVTGLTFTADGSFTGTQTPLTAEVAAPEPASLALLGSGLVGAVVARRRRTAGPSLRQ